MGPAIVLVNNGLIEDIVEKMPANIHTDCIDIGDKVLLPGFVDTHVHINEPGRTEWEGFNTATRSAIAGGITTLVDMPLNSSPVTTSVASFQFKLEAAKEHLHAHCGFWAGVVPGNHQEIAGLIQAGVFGFKAFLSPSGIVDFPNVNESDLSRVMPLIARHRLPLLVHCELEDTAGLPLQKDPFSYYEYLASRPPAWEHNAVALMTRLCETYNCRVHIVHISSAGSLKIIENAKAKGLPLTAETAQHYLYFEAENISNGRTEFKCAPPIRDRANNDLLWKGLENGTIDFVATDHSPAPPELKQIQTGDFTRAWGGIASLQFAFPALWTEAKKRNFSLVDVCAWLSEKPALLAGLGNCKGKIAKGYDADLVVIDPDKSFMVSSEIIQHKHKITPYLGNELYGLIEQTYLEGAKVYDNGEYTQLKKGKILTMPA